MKRLFAVLLLLFLPGDCRAQSVTPADLAAARAAGVQMQAEEISHAQKAARAAGMDIWPSEGLAASYVSMDAPGKWLVVKEGFLPVSRYEVLDGGKAVVFEDVPGTTCGIIFFPPNDSQPIITPVVLGGTPKPPEPPIPPPPPPVSDSPWGTDTHINALIIYETGDSYAEDTETALGSKKIRDYVTSKGGNVMVVDDDYTDEQIASWPNGWKAAYVKARTHGSLPWILVSGGGQWTAEALPADEGKLMELVQKFGG